MPRHSPLPERLCLVGCARLWLEFGVHTAGTIRMAAAWRTKHCPGETSPVNGFDTFTGLPEDWDGQYKKVGVAGGWRQG